MKPKLYFLPLAFVVLSNFPSAQAGDDRAIARKAAVETLTDQVKLANIGLTDKNWAVRQAAVARLVDQALLARVAMEDTDGTARKAAVDRLTEQSVLAEIALEDKACDHVRKDGQWSCTHYLNEHSDYQHTVREAAVARLTDQALLARVAMEDTDGTARKAAVDRLTDQPLLATVALENRDRNIRKAAVARLTDESVLAKVPVADKPFIVRARDAARTHATIDPSPKVQQLIERLRSPTAGLKEAEAAFLLATSSDDASIPAIVPYLIPLLNVDGTYWAEMHNAMREILNDPRNYNNWVVLPEPAYIEAASYKTGDALAAIGRPAAVWLTAFLVFPDSSKLRCRAAMVLGSIQDPSSVEPLTAALSDVNPFVRSMAQNALDLISHTAKRGWRNPSKMPWSQCP